MALSSVYYKREYKSERYESERYDATAYRALDWLLAQQVPSSRGQSAGLVRGGPDVSWISTQHNLIAWFAFASWRARSTRRRTASRWTA